MTILVTGARGHVGSRVLDGLIAAGQDVCAASRGRSTLDLPDGVDGVHLDLEQPETVESALDGVHAVFRYTRPTGFDGFAEAARRAGVRHIVLLSSSAVIEPEPETNPIAIVHRTAERALADTDIGHTVLNPWYYATNALDWAADIRTASTVHVAYPDARVGAIHQADIADVAVTILVEGTHLGESLSLTGPRPLSFRDQAGILGDVLGQPVAVHELTPAQAAERTPIPERVFDGILRSWRRFLTEPAPITDTVEAVTGSAPRSFHRWATEHRAAFEP